MQRNIVMKHKNKWLIACFLLAVPLVSWGQFSQAERDSINRLSAQDHQQMKEQLGINIPNRPGPSGDPNAANAANTNESKVRDYELPDPLILQNGKKVNSSEEWWAKRRPELVTAF